jgi:hypothetical protein
MDLGSRIPDRDASGTVYRIAGFAEDVTERKRVEAALIESERRYRVLFDDNPSMYFMVDAAGIVLSVNRFGAERLGYDVQELLGSSVLNIFTPTIRTTYAGTLPPASPKWAGPEVGSFARFGRTAASSGCEKPPRPCCNDQQVSGGADRVRRHHRHERGRNRPPRQRRIKNQILRSSADCIKVSGSRRAATIHERRRATTFTHQGSQ